MPLARFILNCVQELEILVCVKYFPFNITVAGSLSLLWHVYTWEDFPRGCNLYIYIYMWQLCQPHYDYNITLVDSHISRKGIFWNVLSCRYLHLWIAGSRYSLWVRSKENMTLLQGTVVTDRAYISIPMRLRLVRCLFTARILRILVKQSLLVLNLLLNNFKIT